MRSAQPTPTPAPTPSPQPAPALSCVMQKDCTISLWCDQNGYEQYCAAHQKNMPRAMVHKVSTANTCADASTNTCTNACANTCADTCTNACTNSCPDAYTNACPNPKWRWLHG